MGIHTVNLDNINFNDYNFKEDHPETIIQVSLLALCSKFEKSKTFKKKQKLMLVAKHPTRWWDLYMPEDKKKKRNRTSF